MGSLTKPCPALMTIVRNPHDAPSSHFKPESLDEEYEKVANSRDANKAVTPASIIAKTKTHELLNRLFYPFVFDLKTRVDSLGKLQIKAMRERLESESSPVLGQYEGVAKVGPLGIEGADTMIGYVAVQGFHNLNWMKHDSINFAFIPHTKMTTYGKIYDQIIGLHITPVGDYGASFAKEMAITTQILSELSISTSESLSKETTLANPKLLRETQRFRDAEDHKGFPNQAPLTTMLEGIQTLNQVFSLLSAHKINGIETGADALQAIVEKGNGDLGLTTDFTRRVSAGITGPMTLRGANFEEALSSLTNGKLTLSDRLKETLRTFHEELMRRLPHSGICPMASIFLGKSNLSTGNAPSAIEREKTGIQLLSESYLKVFNHVHGASQNSKP